jgi:hypothetical protein
MVANAPDASLGDGPDAALADGPDGALADGPDASLADGAHAQRELCPVASGMTMPRDNVQRTNYARSRER